MPERLRKDDNLETLIQVETEFRRTLAADTELAVPSLAGLVQLKLDDAMGSTEDINQRRNRISSLHEATFAKSQDTARTKASEQPLALATISQALWEVIQDQDWVLGNGDFRGWVQRLWDFNSPHQDQVGRGGAGLGQGLGHAIGVALANRDKGRVRETTHWVCADVKSRQSLGKRPAKWAC